MGRALATAMLLAALASPAAAEANGDPASDVLLMQDAFFPYAPKVPQGVQDGLTQTLERSREAGFPLKVAVIASKNDLGAIPQFFGAPQPYAEHLESEIGLGKPKPLLVVMPTGFGVAEAGPDARKALEDLDLPDGDSGDSLGRSAIDATRALAEAQGKPLPAPKLPPPVDEGGGTSPIVYLVPVILLALGGGLAALRARQLDKREETAAS